MKRSVDERLDNIEKIKIKAIFDIIGAIIESMPKSMEKKVWDNYKKRIWGGRKKA